MNIPARSVPLWRHLGLQPALAAFTILFLSGCATDPVREASGVATLNQRLAVVGDESPGRVYTVDVPSGATLRGALSTGERNGLGKDFTWFHPIEGLSRAPIELPSYCIEVISGVSREIGALWEILAEEAVGVFTMCHVARDFVHRRSRRRCRFQC